MVKIELGKRDSFLVAFLVVLVGVGFVYAYGGTAPSVMGHSAGELELNGAATVDDAFCYKITGRGCGAAPASSSGCPTGYDWSYTGDVAECVSVASWGPVSCTCQKLPYVRGDFSVKYEDGKYYVRIDSASDDGGAKCSTSWIEGLYADCKAEGASSWDGVTGEVRLTLDNPSTTANELLLSGKAYNHDSNEGGCTCTVARDGVKTSGTYDYVASTSSCQPGYVLSGTYPYTCIHEASLRP